MLVTNKEAVDEQHMIIAKLDLLDRQPFVDRLIGITNMLADSKKNACYAINGGWGVGKTYVLDMFETQIRDYGQEGTTLGKFLVLHYNCWQYDYYDEPLIAFVAAIMDAIDDEVCLLPAEKKEIVKIALREIGKDLLNEANTFIKQKTGVNIKKWITFWKTTKEEAEQKVAEAHSFDTYFDFKKKLAKLKETICTLSENQTVLFVVDELDRCLPEYAIKVLERLHHVFDDIPNVQVVLSVDKQQLENTVAQIYGTGTRVDTYLAKFIDFEICLEEGTVRDNFAKRFKTYVQNFNIIWDDTKAMDVDQFTSRLLDGIGTRQRIALVEKCQLIHEIVATEEVMDTSIMCIELFLVLLKNCNIYVDKAKINFNLSSLFVDDSESTHPTLEKASAGLKKIGDWYRISHSAAREGKYLQRDSNIDRYYIQCRDIWGVVLAVYRRILGFENDYWLTGRQDQNIIMEHVDKFWEVLKTIN